MTLADDTSENKNRSFTKIGHFRFGFTSEMGMSTQRHVEGMRVRRRGRVSRTDLVLLRALGINF